MSEQPKIIPRDNGPLATENVAEVTLADGTKQPLKSKAILCRCGLSKSKPFCDMTHREEGFDSSVDTSALRNKSIEYKAEVEGQEVSVFYTPLVCTHAAECIKRAPNVFNPKQKPWVKPEDGSLQEILDVMTNCPSGALRVSLGGEQPVHLTKSDVEIRVQKNGPYHVTNIELDAEFNGAGASHGKYSLCRCGLSKNKPFCDGTHYEEGWEE